MGIDRALSSIKVVGMLGKKMKDYRMALQMTQEEVAQRAGLSKTTVYNFENGRLANVSLRTFVDLLRALDMLESLGKILPDIPVSPFLIGATGETKKRIIHKRNGKK